MLEVLPDSALDGVDKSLGLAQALAKKGFESLPADRDVSLVFYLTLVLLPSEQGDIFQESSPKRNSVWAHSTGGGKLIFALLEEIVTLQVSFTPINIRESSFQRPLTWAFIVQNGGNDGGRNKYWKSRIQNGPEDPLEVIFPVSKHGGVGGARSNKRSDNRCISGSKSMCRGGRRGATVATLGRSSASKLIFAVVRILARTATSGGLSHQAGWVGAFLLQNGLADPLGLEHLEL